MMTQAQMGHLVLLQDGKSAQTDKSHQVCYHSWKITVNVLSIFK